MLVSVFSTRDADTPARDKGKKTNSDNHLRNLLSARLRNIWRKPGAKHCSSLCSQSEGGANIAAAKHELKNQQSHAQKRWSCSLRVRGPHFASKVSYNAGAATDDYAGQRKSPLRGRWCLFANLDFYGILNILFIFFPVLGLFSNLSSLIMLALLLRISSKIAQKCRYKIAELFLSSLLKRGRPPTG